MRNSIYRFKTELLANEFEKIWNQFHKLDITDFRCKSNLSRKINI